MKKTFQWLSALALIVMGALAIVGCSDNDNDNNGGGNGPVDPKLVGTWVLTSINPDNGQGPQVGAEMTFKSDGTLLADGKSGTFSYDGKKFKGTMGNLILEGEFEVEDNTLTGTVKVTENGQSQTYDMTFQKKGTQPTVSSIKMVGTWKVMIDGGGKLQVGRTATFNDQGNCTIGENNYTYTCEEEEGGRLAFKVYDDGGECVIEGWMVLVNKGNVLNGQYYGYYRKANNRAVAPASLVMKKPGYNYPQDILVQGRWQFKQVAGDSPYFASSLPMAERGEVFVIDEEGNLYVEGEPAVGRYTWDWHDGNNCLDLYFAGYYGRMTYMVGGFIAFSNEGNTMTIPEPRGHLYYCDEPENEYKFQATIQRAEFEEVEPAVSSTKMVGEWEVVVDKNPGTSLTGKTLKFYDDGTCTIGGEPHTYNCEQGTRDKNGYYMYSLSIRDVVDLLYFVPVNGGNVHNGAIHDYPFVIKRKGFTYPTDTPLMGRWLMKSATPKAAEEHLPIGDVVVFGMDSEQEEVYLEGDLKVGTYSQSGDNLTLNLGETKTGKLTISGNTATFKMTMEGQQVTITLVRQ